MFTIINRFFFFFFPTVYGLGIRKDGIHQRAAAALATLSKYYARTHHSLCCLPTLPSFTFHVLPPNFAKLCICFRVCGEGLNVDHQLVDLRLGVTELINVQKPKHFCSFVQESISRVEPQRLICERERFCRFVLQ